MVDISFLNEKSVVRVEEPDKFWIVKNFQIEESILKDNSVLVADWYMYVDGKLIATFNQHRCEAYHFKKSNYRLLMNLNEKSLKDYL